MSVITVLGDVFWCEIPTNTTYFCSECVPFCEFVEMFPANVFQFYSLYFHKHLFDQPACVCYPGCTCSRLKYNANVILLLLLKMSCFLCVLWQWRKWSLAACAETWMGQSTLSSRYYICLHYCQSTNFLKKVYQLFLLFIFYHCFFFF